MPRRPTVNPAMRPTALALNQTLGIADVPSGAEHLLELPQSALAHHRLSPIHPALFALAEGAGTARMGRDYAGQTRNGRLVVGRDASVKWRRTATGSLRAHARVDDSTARHPYHGPATRSRTSATVPVEPTDHSRHLVLAGTFHWTIGGPAQPAV
jgi:hypothetical protein